MSSTIATISPTTRQSLDLSTLTINIGRFLGAGKKHLNAISSQSCVQTRIVKRKILLIDGPKRNVEEAVRLINNRISQLVGEAKRRSQHKTKKMRPTINSDGWISTSRRQQQAESLEEKTTVEEVEHRSAPYEYNSENNSFYMGDSEEEDTTSPVQPELSLSELREQLFNFRSISKNNHQKWGDMSDDDE